MPPRAPAPGFQMRRAGGGAGFAEDRGGTAVGAHLAFVKNDDPCALSGLVDQMRGPQCRQPFLAAKLADMIEKKLPARNVEPDSRLVEQQQAGLVQQARVRSRRAAAGRRSAGGICRGAARSARPVRPRPQSAALLPGATGRARRSGRRGSARASDRDRVSVAGTRPPSAADTPRPVCGDPCRRHGSFPHAGHRAGSPSENRVVLPAPFSPSRTVNSPGSIANVDSAQRLPLAKAVSEAFDGKCGNSHGKSLTGGKRHPRATGRREPI